MRKLVSPGASRMVIEAVDAAAQTHLITWLEASLGAVVITPHYFDESLLQQESTIFVTDGDQPLSAIPLKVPLSMVSVLAALEEAGKRSLVSRFRSIPRIIFFNGLGDIAILRKAIASELGGSIITNADLQANHKADGTLLAFVENDNIHPPHTLAEEMLYFPREMRGLYEYLAIHAPRYLAKAAPQDAWHMVDIRLYDRYEAYEPQYHRFLKAVTAANLGYIVTETWNKESPRFADPIGTYLLRLLTFKPIAQLKLDLIALEYGRDGLRIVDLDLFWHNQKISWQDLMDDKQLRKAIYGDKPILPRSKFFAVHDDKAALISYAKEQFLANLSPADIGELRRMEEDIRH